MSISSDNSTRRGAQGLHEAGHGIVPTRDCMPGNHRVGDQSGGTFIRWRGARVWACGACRAKRESQRAAA